MMNRILWAAAWVVFVVELLIIGYAASRGVFCPAPPPPARGSLRSLHGTREELQKCDESNAESAAPATMF